MYDGKSAVDALSTGLGNLEDLFKTLRDKYTQDLEKKDYEWVEQEQIDWDQVTAKAKAVSLWLLAVCAVSENMHASQNKEAKFRARQGGR